MHTYKEKESNRDADRSSVVNSGKQPDSDEERNQPDSKQIMMEAQLKTGSFDLEYVQGHVIETHSVVWFLRLPRRFR